jgi:hypothetical protein
VYNSTLTLTEGSSETVTPVSSSGPTNLTLSDTLGNSASTTNNYSTPSLSAPAPSLSAVATSGVCNCTANVFDELTYNIAFTTTTGGSLPISVGVKASTTIFSSNGDLAGYNAEVLVGGGTILFLSGTQSQNGPLTFTENQQYPVFMQVLLNPQFGANGSGSADPIFTPPAFDSAGNAITLEISAGIGNNSPAGATPIPAALPLFATGIGGLGLLGWRRKRKARVI